MPGMDGFRSGRGHQGRSVDRRRRALVLLPSFGQRGDGEKARQAGIAAYLKKPVRQSQLYDCLAAVMAGPHEATAAGLPLVTQHSMREAAVSPAKDDLEPPHPDRRRQCRQSEGGASGSSAILAIDARAVPNGQELLEALEHDDVDIILMDCQMPEMDGFAATAEIRRREGASRHTTIIAMTANALDGDLERCVAAGMDDYLSKPVKPELLQADAGSMDGADATGARAVVRAQPDEGMSA